MTSENQTKAPAVEAINLVRTYEADGLEVEALRGVSLAVPKADMVARPLRLRQDHPAQLSERHR